MKINLISSPRNRSTLLMYSFAQRVDTEVIDEPFYASYLKRSGVKHPGQEAILASQSTDFTSANQDLLKMSNKPILFIKNMAHHYFPNNFANLLDFTNILYIRNPRAIIRSYSRVINNITTKDVGIRQVRKMFDYLIDHDKAPIVLDSDDLIGNPEALLSRLCKSLDIDFSKNMLSWPKGPKPYDGVWAPHWYDSVHNSTEFIQAPNAAQESIELPSQHEQIARECFSDYTYLKTHSI